MQTIWQAEQTKKDRTYTKSSTILHYVNNYFSTCYLLIPLCLATFISAPIHTMKGIMI